MASANEWLLEESIRHALDLRQYENGIVRRLIAVLNRTDSRLFAELTEKLEHLGPDSFSVERLDALLASVRALNTEAFEAVQRELTQTLKEFTDSEVAYQRQMLVTALPVQVSVASVSAESVYAAALARPFQGVLLREVWKDLDAQRMKQVRQTIAQGFVEGRTTAQIIRDLRGTRAKGYADGLVNRSRRDVEAVVRTAMGHYAGFVADRSMEANGDLVKAVMWVSTLDLRTTPSCFPAATLALPVGDLRGVTRRHWNGDLIVVTTASGKKLRATPNHPVLTARGWRSIQELKPGKDVLHVVSGDVGGVEPTKNIEMPASIGAIFDALREPTFCDVSTESSSEVDFHGDGMRGNYEVNHPRTERDLRLALNAAFGKQVAEKLLVFVGVPGRLPSEGLPQKVVVGLELVNVSAQFSARSVEDGIEAGFADASHAANIDGLGSADEHFDDLGFVRAALGLAAAKSRHHSGAFEDPGHGGSGYRETTSDGCGGFPIRVTADDVVAVEREFFSGHVYNLSTSTAFYIADGIVVHNCQVRDGKQYTPDTHKPIGHSLPWGQGPGRYHWNCRSHQVPVTKSWRELGVDMDEFTPESRASMDGQVPAETTYQQWLSKQSAGRQDQVLGRTRGQLLRAGNLPIERMYDNKGAFISLEELRSRDAEAFKRAGL